MERNENIPIQDGINELMPLLSEQMLTAERVMTAVGHICGQWRVPRHDSPLLIITCTQCELEASIHLVDSESAARYTVLLLPAGSCHAASRALTDERHPYNLNG